MIEKIDIYCERIDFSFWAEPVNALTNLSFIVAAFGCLMLARQEKRLSLQTLVLTFLVLAIGIGSFLFHTFATRWAMLSDVLPILFYQIAFLFFYARDVMKLRWPPTFVLFMLYIGATFGFGSLPQDWLNGSLGYAPAFLFLLGFGLWHYNYARKEYRILLVAVLVFALSLTFRSIDMAVCENLPLGVHFLWHILNGIVLYLTTRGYIVNSGEKNVLEEKR